MKDFNSFIGFIDKSLPEIKAEAYEQCRRGSQDERAVDAAARVTLEILRRYHEWTTS